MKLWTVTLSMLALAPAARADDEQPIAEIVKAVHERRTDEARELMDEALRAASRANDPLRLGRLELLRAELEADHPTDGTVASARAAVLHLGRGPEAELATLRYHVSGAQVAIGEGRLGAAALHVQEAHTALEKIPAPSVVAGRKPEPWSTDPRRDGTRLANAERALIDALRHVVDARPSNLAPGTAAALAAYATSRPLVASGHGDEPEVPKARPSFEGLKARIDRALADAEARTVAAADKRGDAPAAAAARGRWAEALLRLGRRDEAIRVRRAALAFYRERGSIDEVINEDRWIAERFDKDQKGALQARNELLSDLERHLATLVGPARAAAHAKYRQEYVALVELLAASAGREKGTGGDPLALIDAVDRLHDRSIWDEALILGDARRWARAARVSLELRRALEGAVREERATAARDDREGAAAAASMAVQAQQRAAEALVKGEVLPSPEPLDGASLAERLGGRALLVYGRLDPARMAIAARLARGPTRLVIVKLSDTEERSRVEALQAAFARGGNDWRGPAQALYESLVAPVEAAVTDKGMVIVPDGALAAIPFPALLDRRGRLLGARTTFAFEPSLRAFQRPPGAKITEAAALVLAVRRFSDGSPPLPNAEQEANGIWTTLTRLGRKTRLASPAITPGQLRAEEGPFDVVHLAARARLDGGSPLLGSLTLATSPLPAFALGASGWHANVVVLSIPSDGAPPGRVVAGARGLAGLAAAVLAGPAPSVVLSLGPEGGPAMAALLGRFHERYAGGESPSVALAGAQRDLRESRLDQAALHQAGADPLADGARFAHPRFWAPFVVWGQP